MEHIIAIGLGLLIGLPLSALVYFSSKREQKMGLRPQPLDGTFDLGHYNGVYSAPDGSSSSGSCGDGGGDNCN